MLHVEGWSIPGIGACEIGPLLILREDMAAWGPKPLKLQDFLIRRMSK